MKLPKSSTVLIIPMVMLTASCSQDSHSPGPVEGKPIHISARVAERTTDFAFDLLKQIHAERPENEDVFVSPLSLHIALGMVANGAEGETRKGILKTLKTESESIEELNNAYKTLVKQLPEADKKVKLSIANSLWYRKGFSFNKSFADVLTSIFDSKFYGEPFDNGTVKKINQWASDHTEGKIKSVIDKISDDYVMFLMNALYFKGDWKYTFPKNETKPWDFKTATGSTRKVQMMFAESDFRIYADADLSAFELPYSSGQFNMTILLPANGKTLNDVVGILGHSKWTEIQTNLTLRGVRVGLPRFSLEYDIQLGKTLSAMGMEKAFNPGAEFSAISDDALSLGFVKQNTFLDVNEEGTEAAAVTTVGLTLTSVGPGQMPTIIADQPFLMVISENTSNTILFTGKIVNP